MARRGGIRRLWHGRYSCLLRSTEEDEDVPMSGLPDSINVFWEDTSRLYSQEAMLESIATSRYRATKLRLAGCFSPPYLASARKVSRVP